jgi:hypothetical protein
VKSTGRGIADNYLFYSCVMGGAGCYGYGCNVNNLHNVGARRRLGGGLGACVGALFVRCWLSGVVGGRCWYWVS